MKCLLTTLLMAGFAAGGQAETLSGLCMISTSHNGDAAEVIFRSSDCGVGSHNCSMSDNSNTAWTRWAGVSSEALKREGAQINALMRGDPGDLHCSGTVHDGILAGRYEFTPNPAFSQRLASMGFNDITPRKQEAFLMLDVTTQWIEDIKHVGVTGLTTDKLMGLRALRVDRDYIRAMSAAGYTELSADKLTAMKATGVTPDKAKEAKSLGFQPTEEELIQMCIFKIDRPFVERMRAKGLIDLTLAKLIKIKIFKLED